MTDYLNLDDASDLSGGDFLSDGSYLDLDDPPAPMEAPMPPAAPGQSMSADPAPYHMADMQVASADAGDWLGASADTNGDWLGASEPADTSWSSAPAVATPAANPSMHDLSVQAPLLEDVHQQGITIGGSRGDLSTLVLDVEVPVEVYFGDASLTVEEFLEMGAGSVVELDHAITAPIELRVRGKLVAHGQLVTINGNYGMRITEMLDGGAR